MKLYIFRHGQTDGNVRNIVQGAGIDLPLNETGKVQAENLKASLAKENLPVIYCSKMQRAQNTAQIVASSNGAAVVPIDGLEEVHFGEAEGMLSADAHVKYADIFAIIHDPDNPLHNDIGIPGSETVRQSTERGIKALEHIRDNCRFDKAGVASHGALMFNLYKHYFGEEHRFENCEYFILDI